MTDLTTHTTDLILHNWPDNPHNWLKPQLTQSTPLTWHWHVGLLSGDDQCPVSRRQKHAQADEVFITALDVAHHRQQSHRVAVAASITEFVHAEPGWQSQAWLWGEHSLSC